jgi:hypothetical protein
VLMRDYHAGLSGWSEFKWESAGLAPRSRLVLSGSPGVLFNSRQVAQK